MGASDRGKGPRRRAVLVGAFRSIIPEGGESPFGSQGGFVDTLAPAPYSLANGKLKAFADDDVEVRERWTIEVLNLSEPLELEDDREEVQLGEDAFDAILDLDPDLVAFSAYCWNIDTVLEASRELKVRRPELMIIVGGRAVEGESEELLRSAPAVDALVVGEGELAFREILRRDARDLGGISSVVWRQGSTISSGGGQPWCVTELDQIPSPYLSGTLEPPLHGVMIEMTRGCLNTCGYCTWSADRRLRWYSPERIEAEIRWVRDRGHRHVTINDAAINYDGDRLSSFVEAVNRADPGGVVRFTYNVRHELLDASQFGALSRLPTHMVLLGLESLKGDAFKEIDRSPPDRREIERQLHELSEATRPPVVSIMLGIPGDSEEGFRETLETLLRWTEPGADGVRLVGTVLVSLLQVYRGSKLWERRKELGLRFRERGIPYLIEGAGWSREALSRAKSCLLSKMSEHPEELKAAEAIVMAETHGGVDPWLTRRRIATLLQQWPIGVELEGWTFERFGLLRDTGQAHSLRFSWHSGGEVRLLLKRRSSGIRTPEETRLYSIETRSIRDQSPPEASQTRLRSMVRELLLAAEERVAETVARRRG